MGTTIQEFSKTEAALAALREKYQGAKYEVATPEGMAAAKAARKELRGYRTSLEKKRKEIKDEALKHCQLIDSEARRIRVELEALEGPIATQIDEEEQRADREREAAIQREQERVEKIHERIADIRSAAEAALRNTYPAEKLAVFIADTEKVPIDEFFAEFQQQAQDAKDATLARLRDLHTAAAAREEEATRVAKEREELAQLRARQERQDTIRRRIADIRSAAGFSGNPSSGLLASRIREVEALEIDPSYEEFTEEAYEAKRTTIAKLSGLYAQAIEIEKEEQRRREELERKERELAEQQKRAKREADIRNQIQVVKNLPATGYGKTAAELTRILARAESFAIQWQDRDAPELRQEADEAKRASIAAIATMLTERKEYEAEQAERQRKEREAAERRKAAEEAGRKGHFPGTDAIVAVLAEHYGVPEVVVHVWLSQLREAA